MGAVGCVCTDPPKTAGEATSETIREAQKSSQQAAQAETVVQSSPLKDIRSEVKQDAVAKPVEEPAAPAPAPAPAAAPAPTPAPAKEDKPDQWEVRFPKGMNEKLGVKITTHSFLRPYLSIGGVADGPVDAFNKANPDKAVLVNYKLFSVNGVGKGDAETMSKALQQPATEMVFVVGKPSDPKDWTASIEKKPGMKLGVRLVTHSFEKEYLTVGAITSGLIDDFNKQNPSMAIEAEDRIMAVNGVKDPKDMSDEIQKEVAVVKLSMQRDT